MKKIFYILVSAIVALGAVACNNEIDENIEANRSEGVSFTASLDETASRILVGDLNESGKHPITFESDDVIYATYYSNELSDNVAPFAFTTTDGVTFTCLENNADGLAPQTLIGQLVEFSVNELDSSKGVDGIALYASQSFENKSTVTLGLANYCGVFAFTSSHEVTLTASTGIFSWEIEEGDYWTGTEITIPAAEGIQYVPFIPQLSEFTLSYSIGGEKVKEITRVFSNKIYTLGGLNEAVASVNGVNYTDINKAIEAAVAAGQDVVLADDATVTEPILVPEGAEVTIDLNGMELSADNTTYAINNLGTLTLKDSNAGAIPSSSSVMAKTSAEIDWSVSARGIYNGYDKDGNYVTTAKLIIESGNYQATGTNGGAVVFNYGTVEIKGGYFQSNGGYGLNNQTADATMTVENAKVEGGIYNKGTLTVKDTELLQHLSGKHAIYNWAGSVTIDGGEFDSLSGNELILADGENATVIINNGTFKKTAKSWLFGAATGKNISFVINDGTFYGYVNEPEMTVDTIRPNGDPIVVKGGSFNFDPTNWLAEGLAAVKNAETNMWDVKTPAASVGGEEYVTIEEAIAAAKEIGGEVTVNVVAGTYDSFPATELTEGVTLECAEGTVFEGSSSLNIGGATVKGATFSNDGGNAVGGTVNGDFEDCVFTGTNGHRYCYLPEDGEITYTNCVFEGSVYGVHFDGGNGAKLIFRNCEFYGFNALPGTIDVEFYDCFFGHKEGGSGYNGINLWGNTYMEDTQFDWTADGVIEYCDPCQATPTYEFKNVTVNKTGTWEPIQFSDMYQPEGVVVTIDGVVYQNVADGVCTVDGVYEISNKNGMFWFANEVNANGNNFSGKTVKLANNIDLESAAWTPVGQTGVATFNGLFDGQEHVISNLVVDSKAQTGGHYSSGLFGWVESHTAGHGHIKNVTIDGATIEGNHNCGALVGYITQETALVENCHVKNATVKCYYANGDAEADKAGGLIGNATVATPVKNCSATNVTVVAGRDAGILIGAANTANMENLTADGTNSVKWSEDANTTGKNIGLYWESNTVMVSNGNGLIGRELGTTKKIHVYQHNNTWNPVYLYTWDAAGVNYTGAWAGSQMTATTVSGKSYMVYTLPAAATDKSLNLIFNNGASSQTIDFEVGIFDADKYYILNGSEIITVTDSSNPEADLPAVEPEAKKLYMKDACGWDSDNAVIYAYIWNPSAATWIKMTDADNDKIYECELPTSGTYTQVIFVRKSTEGEGWNNVWNQTADLNLPTDGKNMWTMSAWSTGSWSTK